jgi:hypothetical protein
MTGLKTRFIHQDLSHVLLAKLLSNFKNLSFILEFRTTFHFKK